jgi:uncharacterized membrane protein YbhN (UPF0104 family)
MPKQKLQPRFIFRRILFFVSAVASLIIIIYLLVTLLLQGRGLEIPDSLKPIFYGSLLIFIGNVILAIIEHSLEEWRESRRRKDEEAKELRKKLLKPASRDLTKADIGGGYLTGEGESGGTLPADIPGPSGGGEGGAGGFTGGDLGGGEGS